MSDIQEALRAAANAEGLSIGEAWALLDRSADRRDEYAAEIHVLRAALAAERQKRCGTCELWSTWGDNTHGICCNESSACHGCMDAEFDVVEWPASHGCPHWRAKEGR